MRGSTGCAVVAVEEKDAVVRAAGKGAAAADAVHGVAAQDGEQVGSRHVVGAVVHAQAGIYVATGRAVEELPRVWIPAHMCHIICMRLRWCWQG